MVTPRFSRTTAPCTDFAVEEMTLFRRLHYHRLTTSAFTRAPYQTDFWNKNGIDSYILSITIGKLNERVNPVKQVEIQSAEERRNYSLGARDIYLPPLLGITYSFTSLQLQKVKADSMNSK